MRINYLPSKEATTKATEWTEETTLNSTTWTQVWLKSGVRFYLHMTFFQLNTDKVLFRVTKDTEVLISLDLEELSKIYKMSYASGHHADCFPLFEQASNVWRYGPPIPELTHTSFAIDLKTTAGSGELVRGISFWSPA